MPRLREKQRLREHRLLGIKPGIPTYIPPELIARGFKLKFYDTSDVKIGEIGSDVKTGGISNVAFELMGLGCAAFSFVIDEMPKIFKYEVDVEDESLVGYWPFDELSGMVAYDKSLYGNDGDLINMEEGDHVPGKINNGLDFDCVDEHVEVPPLPSNVGAFSVVLWINTIRLGDYAYYIHRGMNSSLGSSIFCLGQSTANDLMWAVNGLYLEGRSNVLVPESEDICLIGTYDGDKARLFLNGNLIHTYTVGTITNQITGNKMGIGGSPFSVPDYRFADGVEDEVLIYNRALTATEAKAFAELKVGKYVDAFDMAYRTRVDIHPYFDESPWFTGFIQTLPQQGQKKPFEYSGFGFFDQLDWVTVTGSYENQDIAVIVKDIIQNTVAPSTQIIYNESKVQSPSYTVVKIDFDHTLAKDAIQTLADMAQDYEFGVDGSREFYFRPIDTTIHHNYWMGKHFQDAEIEKNPFTVRNKLYIKIGQIQAGGSNIIGSVQSDPSINAYGLREEVINVPESLNPTDAQRWAADILARMKDPEVKAKIKSIFLDESKTKIEAKGKVKITAHDGTEYTFFIKRVAYAISPEGILGDVDLE